MNGIIKFDYRLMPTIKIKLTSTLYESATTYKAVPHNDRKMTATMRWSELLFERAKGKRKSLRDHLKNIFC